MSISMLSPCVWVEVLSEQIVAHWMLSIARLMGTFCRLDKPISYNLWICRSTYRRFHGVAGPGRQKCELGT